MRQRIEGACRIAAETDQTPKARHADAGGFDKSAHSSATIYGSKLPKSAPGYQHTWNKRGQLEPETLAEMTGFMSNPLTTYLFIAAVIITIVVSRTTRGNVIGIRKGLWLRNLKRVLRGLKRYGA